MIQATFSFPCGGLVNNSRFQVDTGASEIQADVNSCVCLPVYVFADNVLRFLHLQEIVRLDTALMNQQLRRLFYDSLKSFSVPVPVNFRHLEWCSKRKCRVGFVELTSKLPDTITIYAKRVLQTIKTLKIYPAAKITPPAMHFLLRTCTRLATLNMKHFCAYTDLLFASTDIYSTIHHIDVSENSAITDNALMPLLHRCPELRVLDISDCPQLTYHTLNTIAQHCTQLRELHYVTTTNASLVVINPVFNDWYSVLFTHCTLLTHVAIGDYVTVEALHTLATHCRNLIHLHINDAAYRLNTTEPDALVETALLHVIQQCTLIITLALQNVPITNNVMLAIAHHLPNLQTLVIENGRVDYASLCIVRDKCVYLKELVVLTHDEEGTLTHTDQQEQIINSLLHGPQHTLTSLIVQGTFSNHNLPSILTHNSNLGTLAIQLSNSVDSSVWCSALSELPHIADLTMQSLWDQPTGVDDSVLFTMAQSCRKLSTVNLCYNYEVTELGFTYLAALPLLHLYTTSCTHFTDRSINCIARQCTKLITLYIGDTAVTSSGVCSIARYCKEVRYLDICYLRTLRNSAVQAVVRNLHGLRELDLRGNKLITFGAVKNAPLHCPKMCCIVVSWPMHRCKYSLYYWKHWHYFHYTLKRSVGGVGNGDEGWDDD